MLKAIKVTLLSLAFISLFGYSARAAAPYIAIPGASCRPYLGSVTSWVSDFGGFQTTTASSTDIVCPINPGYLNASSSIPAARVVMYYKDNSTTGAFTCQVSMRTASGGVWNSTLLYTAATAGGDSNPTTAYTGEGYLEWSYAAGELPNNTGSGSFVIPVDGNTVIKCTSVQNGAIIRHAYSDN